MCHESRDVLPGIRLSYFIEEDMALLGRAPDATPETDLLAEEGRAAET